MVGETFSNYRVLGRVGAGGMGVVYEAEDVRLGRRVAVKMLHDAEKRPEVMERFRREARTASSLNHPNICTIYGIEEVAGRQFIIMELLQGETLTQRIGRKALTPDLVIEYGIQIADALDAAHRKGIIHRDIKPANLFLNDREQIKVLDFGLAKLDDITASLEIAASTSGSGQPSGLPTSSQVTREGRTMGTLHYMSPEQARGEELDPRSDLFSFGAVLYEMATGTPPFKGGTAAIVFSEILNTNPAPPSQSNPALPVRLDEIILKALEKDKDLRYQSAAELRADLKRLKRDSESSQSAASAGFAAVRTAKPKNTRKFWATTAAIMAVAVAGAVLWWKPWHRPPEAAAAAQWQQLTDFADSASQPALSPDGHMLAFIRGGGTFLTRGQIYVKLLPNGEAKPLTHDPSPKGYPVFTPDGSSIVYTLVDPKFGWNSEIVPVLGGEPRIMLPNASGLSYGKGDQVLFSEFKRGVNLAIVTAAEGRQNERDIYVPPSARGMAHSSMLSPDGKWVVLTEMDNDGWEPCRVVPFDGSNPGHRIGPAVSHCTSAVWGPDSRTVYFGADAGAGFHLFRQDIFAGEPQQLTFGPTEQEGVIYDASTNSLITSAGNDENTLWLRKGGEERQISGEGFADFPQLSRDGKHIYYMVLKNKVGAMGFVSGQMYDAAQGTSEIVPVLPGTDISSFSVAPEGDRVYFAAYDADHHPHIWSAPLDRSAAPRQLFPDEADQPLAAPGGVVYYRSHSNSSNQLMRYRPDGTREKIDFPEVHELQSISPSGRWVVAWAQLPSDPGSSWVVLIDTTNGHAIPACHACNFTWSPDGGEVQVVGPTILKGDFTVVFSLKAGEEIPPIPASGLSNEETVKALGGKVVPGFVLKTALPDTWLVMKSFTHRNIYRIPLQ